MEKSTFGKRLEEIMREKNVSRVVLKGATGISLQSISNYLNDKRKPDCEMVAEISKALNVSADYLLGLSEASTRDETIQGVHDLTGLSQAAISKLSVEKYCDSNDIADFVSFLIENENFSSLVREIKNLSKLQHTTIDAVLDIAGEQYDVDFNAAFKLIVTDMFWEIARGYNNPFKLTEIHRPITI